MSRHAEQKEKKRKEKIDWKDRCNKVLHELRKGMQSRSIT